MTRLSAATPRPPPSGGPSSRPAAPRKCGTSSRRPRRTRAADAAGGGTGAVRSLAAALPPGTRATALLEDWNVLDGPARRRRLAILVYRIDMESIRPTPLLAIWTTGGTVMSGSGVQAERTGVARPQPPEALPAAGAAAAPATDPLQLLTPAEATASPAGRSTPEWRLGHPVDERSSSDVVPGNQRVVTRPHALGAALGEQPADNVGWHILSRSLSWSRPRGHTSRGDYHRPMAMKSVAMQASVAPSIGEAAVLSAAACMFRSLGDPARLAILRHLSSGEHKVVDLTTHLGLAQSTVSAHLACLRDCGLVTSRPQGRASMWSLIHSTELLDVLAAAERLLAATGDAVALCPTYGEAANR